MTGSTQEYIDYVLEQLQSVHALTSGRFFGGLGVKSGRVQFAMIMGNSLYFVVDDSTRPKYEAMGSTCFWYTTKKGRINVRKYYRVPDELFEDQALLLQWAQEAARIADTLKK